MNTTAAVPACVDGYTTVVNDIFEAHHTYKDNEDETKWSTFCWRKNAFLNENNYSLIKDIITEALVQGYAQQVNSHFLNQMLTTMSKTMWRHQVNDDNSRVIYQYEVYQQIAFQH